MSDACQQNTAQSDAGPQINYQTCAGKPPATREGILAASVHAVTIVMEPVFIDRPTARQLLANISDRKLDELIKAGRVNPQMIDGKIVFTVEEIKRFATSCPSWEPRSAR